MSDFFRLLKRMGIWHKYVFLLILRSPFDALRTWMLAGLIKNIFLCIEIRDTGRLAVVCLIYGLICALLFLYNGTIWSIYADFSGKVEACLQKIMLQKILGLSFRQVDRHFSGEWITRLNSDIQAAFTMMNGPLTIPVAMVSIINMLLSSLLLFKSSFLLCGAAWILLLPHLFMNYKLALRHMPGLKENAQKAMAESTSAIKPLITEADAILLYDAGNLMMKKCEESSRRLMKINQSMHMRNALSSAFLRLFGDSGYLVILIIGYGLILRGDISFSDAVYCFQMRGSILAGMFMLITCLNNIKANLVCVKRINAVFEEENDVK